LKLKHELKFINFPRRNNEEVRNNSHKTDNIRIKGELRHVRATIVTVKNQ